MTTEATIQGQAAALGRPVIGKAGSAITPQAKQMSVIARNGSSLILMSAFQPAWSAAAVKTARKTGRVRCMGVACVLRLGLDHRPAAGREGLRDPSRRRFVDD